MMTLSKRIKYTGTCKRFDTRKGFGFICVDDGSDHVFVHQTEIHSLRYRTLHKGQRLEFGILPSFKSTNGYDSWKYFV